MTWERSIWRDDCWHLRFEWAGKMAMVMRMTGTGKWRGIADGYWADFPTWQQARKWVMAQVVAARLA